MNLLILVLLNLLCTALYASVLTAFMLGECTQVPAILACVLMIAHAGHLVLSPLAGYRVRSSRPDEDK